VALKILLVLSIHRMALGAGRVKTLKPVYF